MLCLKKKKLTKILGALPPWEAWALVHHAKVRQPQTRDMSADMRVFKDTESPPPPPKRLNSVYCVTFK